MLAQPLLNLFLLSGEYHALPLDREAAAKEAVSRLVLEPKGGG